MRMEKLTSKLQQALADAQSLAVGKDHNYIEPVHLISVLVDHRNNRKIIPVIVELEEKDLRSVRTTHGDGLDFTTAAGVKAAVDWDNKMPKDMKAPAAT